MEILGNLEIVAKIFSRKKRGCTAILNITHNYSYRFVKILSPKYSALMHNSDILLIAMNDASHCAVC